MLAENVLWHLNPRSRRPENNLDGTRADRPGTAAIGAALGADGPALTASFGVAEHPPDAWRDLLDRAEAALTRAKRAGRNRCEVA